MIVKARDGKRDAARVVDAGWCWMIVILTCAVIMFSCAGFVKREASLHETVTHEIDAIMGDWQGRVVFRDGTVTPIVAQVIALGNGEYRAKVLPEFDRRVPPLAVLGGRDQEGIVQFSGRAEPGMLNGSTWRGVASEQEFIGTITGSKTGNFELNKVVRLSPSLGAQPPAGAIVLFDGSNLDEWEHLGDPPGLINLAKNVGGSDCAAYLRSEVWSRTKQEAILELGSDDGIKVWLNSDLVHANNAARGVTPGEDKVEVTLRQGWNQLMLKVTNGGGGWGAMVRLVASDSGRLLTIGEKDPQGSKSEATRKYLESTDDYLTVWSVSGPYRRPGKGMKEIFDIPFAPEKAGASGVEWLPLALGDQDKSVKWNLVDGAMEVKPGSGSIVTKRKFRDVQLHVEFRTPFMPEARGQGRGNSGVYLQGRYEVQVLDSYGLEGKDNECGGIYKVARPEVNMCAPPRQWQTYDITFHAPRFDAAGNKTENARLTVFHNGVKIHDHIEIPEPTGGALDHNISQPGGLYLQDHGNRVQYRNLWLVEL